MNIGHIPELDFTYRYLMAIVVMTFAAELHCMWFKWKKWLSAAQRIRALHRPARSCCAGDRGRAISTAR